MFKKAPLQFYLAAFFSLLRLILPTQVYLTYSLIELYYTEFNWIFGLTVETHYYSWGSVSYASFIYLKYPTLALVPLFMISSAVIIFTAIFLIVLVSEVRNFNQGKQYHKERVVSSAIILFIIEILYAIPQASIYLPISFWIYTLAMVLAYWGNRIVVYYLPMWEESKQNYDKRYRKKDLN